jgi:hypothetical protein
LDGQEIDVILGMN